MGAPRDVPEERARGTNKGNGSLKLTTDRPFADPEKAARKLLEIANTVERVQAMAAAGGSTTRA